MNDEALREKIDNILMEAEGKYFSSQYDNQATEGIRWPTRDQILHLISEDRERVEREARLAESKMFERAYQRGGAEGIQIFTMSHTEDLKNYLAHPALTNKPKQDESKQ